MSANFSHQAGLFNPRSARPVVIIGAGMIGSWVAFALAKKGATDITVIDEDVVDSHNIPMSLYRPADLYCSKVAALGEIVNAMTGVTIKTIPEMYTGDPLPKSTVICCVDKMSVRSVVWEQVKIEKIKHDLFVDTRTAATYAEVFAISPRLPDEQKYYEKFLHSDEEAARQTCGHHGIIDVAFAVTASVSATVTRFWQTGQKRAYHAMRCDIPRETNQEGQP